MSRHLLLAGSGLALVLAGCAATTTTSNAPVSVAAAEAGGNVMVPARPAALGESLTGDLSEGDSRTSEDGLLDRYLLNLAAGTRVEVVMRSEIFDAYLIAGRDGGEGFEEIARDDDGLGEGLNSRLRFTAEEAGLYEIRARGFAGMGEGAYSISFADRGPPPYTPPPGSLARGAEVTGALAEGDAVFEDNEGYRYDAYRFSARAGDRYDIVARSDAFDTVLEVGRDAYGAWSQLGYDDDGLGEGLNSRLRFTAPADGEYVVRLSSFGEGSSGDYSIALTELGPIPAPQPAVIGTPFHGVMSEEDPEDENGERFDPVGFTARAGDRLEIVGRSSAFDMVMELGQRDGDMGWTQLAYDDDGLGEGSDSRIRFTVPADGDYEVRVRTYDGLSLGQYVVSVSDRGPLPPPPPSGVISTGDRIDGELVDGDGVTAEEYVHDDFRLQARRGQRLAITLRSDEIDTLVRLGRIGRDGAFEEIAYDDDSAGDLDSRLLFTPDANGEYIVRVTTFSPNVIGPYALSVTDLGQPPRAQRLRLGRNVTGALTDRDGLTEVEARYDPYVFRLEEGDRAQFIARSDEFDAMLLVARPLGDGTHEFLAYDDDGLGEGTNSRLVFTAPETGNYELWVTPFDAAGLGDYSLESTHLGPTPPPVRMDFGQSVVGQLEPTDGVTVEGPNYDAYAFTAAAGQRVRVEMRSGDFDAFLLLGLYGPGGLSAIAEDDDGLGEGTDSRLTYTLPQTGEYEFWATSYATGEAGAYEVRLTDLGPAPAPGSIVVGSTVRGELTAEDPQDEYGSHYDAYRFTAAEGERIRITLTSNAFDAFLYLGRVTDGVFAGEWSDDDGLSDLNSLLEFTAPAAGEYVVRVRSYGPGATGEYVLTLEPAAN